MPRRGSAEHRDFERGNDILEVVAEQIQQTLATRIIGEIDQVFGRFDDVVTVRSERKARETALTNAEILRQLRGVPLSNDDF